MTYLELQVRELYEKSAGDQNERMSISDSKTVHQEVQQAHYDLATFTAIA